MRYNDEDYNELKRDLSINRDLLDEEVIKQPNGFFHASEGFSFAAARRDKKKYDVDLLASRLDRDIRDEASSEGYKITEAQIKHRITSEAEYDRVYQDYLDLSLLADRWEHLKNAYRMRADMLRALVQLHQTGYFGEVTGSAERRSAKDRYSERRRD
jgi:hypothetical protein